MEDFRVQVTLPEREEAELFQDDLRAAARGVEGLAGVMVSRDGRHVFMYTDTEDQARDAERLARSLLASAETSVTRWHPIEEAWKDVSIPLPATAEDEAAELQAREAAEIEEAAAEGDYDWHVIVELPGRGAAVELERALSAEGVDVRRRWRFVVAGVLTEERAEELAERITAEHPDADVWIEANLSDVEHSPLQFLPF